MEEVRIIGVDLAKNVFQLHGAAADGAVVFRKKLSRLLIVTENWPSNGRVAAHPSGLWRLARRSSTADHQDGAIRFGVTAA